MIKQSLIVIITALVFKNFLEYYFDSNVPTGQSSNEFSNKIKVFNPSDLNQEPNKLLLSILGSVYDVTKGEKHYGKGGSYEFFVGRDASRAFVTGKFEEDLTDQVEDLSEAQIGDLFNWKSFYDKTYTYLGVLNGRFYTQTGQKTDYLLDLEKAFDKHKLNEKKAAEFNNKFPICNSEWTQEKGMVKVWCSTESGGVKRTWTGYPRLVYNPNNKQETCACVNEQDLSHPSVKLYPNCDPKSIECRP